MLSCLKIDQQKHAQKPDFAWSRAQRSCLSSGLKGSGRRHWPVRWKLFIFIPKVQHNSCLSGLTRLSAPRGCCGGLSTLRGTPPQHLFDVVLFGVEIWFEFVFAQSIYTVLQNAVCLNFVFGKSLLESAWGRFGPGVEQARSQARSRLRPSVAPESALGGFPVLPERPKRCSKT